LLPFVRLPVDLSGDADHFKQSFSLRAGADDRYGEEWRMTTTGWA